MAKIPKKIKATKSAVDAKNETKDIIDNKKKKQSNKNKRTTKDKKKLPVRINDSIDITQEEKDLNRLTVNDLELNYQKAKKQKSSKVKKPAFNMSEDILNSLSNYQFLITSDTYDELQQSEYFISEMNRLGENTRNVFEKIYKRPETDETQIKKKIKRGKFSFLNLILMPALMYGAYKLPNILNGDYRLSDKIPKVFKKSEPDKDNKLFNLKGKDKSTVKNLADVTTQQLKKLEKTIQFLTGGTFPSLMAFLLGYKFIEDSSIFRFFKRNILEYSTAIYETFIKVVKTIATWASNAKRLFSKDGLIKLRNSAIEKIKRIIKGEDNSTFALMPIPGASQLILYSIKSMVLSLFGVASNDNDSSSSNFYNGGSNSKIAEQHINRRIFKNNENTDTSLSSEGAIGIPLDGTYVAQKNAVINSGFHRAKASILWASQQLGINPNHLAAVISFETGGKFSPATKNPGSSATGLIQFMAGKGGTPGKYYGLTRNEFANLSVEAQMKYVVRYFKERGLKPGATVGQVYDAVTGTGYSMYSSSRSSRAAYAANKVWDVNKDGTISPGEAVHSPKFKQHMAAYYPEYLGKGIGGPERLEKPLMPKKEKTIKSTIESPIKTKHIKNDNNYISAISTTINQSPVLKKKRKQTIIYNISSNNEKKLNTNNIKQLSLPNISHEPLITQGSSDFSSFNSSKNEDAEPIKSFFELLMDKDLMGQMAT